MATKEVAFLGPVGTYSHLVAEKRFGTKSKLVPLPTVLDVCSFVSNHSSRTGIVPIENSSGGAIYETVDILLTNKPRVYIVEELALNVKLALLGHKGERVKILYSHFAPLEHCAPWIRKHLPRVEKRVVASTAIAAQQAASNIHAAALASRRAARLCYLDVLEYPVAADIPNLTMFLAIRGRKPSRTRGHKTTLAVKLPNEPGSLYTLLGAFREQNINLSRLISRPIRGCPREYAFLVDVEGDAHARSVKAALATARKTSTELRVVGSYPTRKPYTS